MPSMSDWPRCRARNRYGAICRLPVHTSGPVELRHDFGAPLLDGDQIAVEDWNEAVDEVPFNHPTLAARLNRHVCSQDGWKCSEGAHLSPLREWPEGELLSGRDIINARTRIADGLEAVERIANEQMPPNPHLPSLHDAAEIDDHIRIVSFLLGLLIGVGATLAIGQLLNLWR